MNGRQFDRIRIFSEVSATAFIRAPERAGPAGSVKTTSNAKVEPAPSLIIVI